MRSLMLAFFALTVGATLGGCGGDSQKKPPPPAITAQQRGVLETVDSLQTASRRGDGERICREIFTPKLAASVKAAARTSCAQEVRANLFSPQTSLTVGRDIRAGGTRAAARVVDQNGKVSTLFLVQEAGKWRIDRVKPGGPVGR